MIRPNLTIIFNIIYIATLLQRTITRLIKKNNYSKTSRLSHSFNFYKKRPQIKGVVFKVTTMSPKKPNSANRHIAKINLTSKLKVTCRLPGKGYLCTKFNRVLVNGGRANDLPGVSYTLIRGGYDFSPMFGKKKRRSVYGVGRPEGHSSHIRRKNRNL